MDELLKQLEDFNKNSPHKIQFTINKEKSCEDMWRIGSYANSSYVRFPEYKYEYIFVVRDSSNVEYTISTYGLVNDGFQLSKMICERENARLSIHFLIKNNCYSLLKDHERISGEWNEYLANWDKHSYLSVYKTYGDAAEAHERFLNGFPDRMREHLKKYHPEVIQKIKLLKQSISSFNENIKQLIKDKEALLKVDISMSVNAKYLYNLEV